MANIVLGRAEINIISAPNPIFKVTRPDTSLTVVVPVSGPPGPAGASSVSDSSVASVINNPVSESHGAVVTIVHIETEPLIAIDLLFDNALA